MIKYTKEYSFGPLTLVEDEEALTNILFTDGSEFDCDCALTPLLEKGFQQLEEYFDHKRFLLTVDFRLPEGEEEEIQVLEILCRLPYGESYPIECVTEGVGLPLNPDTKAEIIDIMELNPLPSLLYHGVYHQHCTAGGAVYRRAAYQSRRMGGLCEPHQPCGGISSRRHPTGSHHRRATPLRFGRARRNIKE